MASCISIVFSPSSGARQGRNRHGAKERQKIRQLQFLLAVDSLASHAGHNHAAPRTPLLSPCLACTSCVATWSENTCRAHSSGTRS